MNDITTLFSQGAMDLSTFALGGLGGSARKPTISLDNDRFTFIDEAEEKTPHPDLKLKVIIIGVNPGPSRLFWGRPYGERVDDPPACFSDNGIGPSTQAAEPQNATCKGCPKSEWGSAVSNLTGEGIPACSSKKKIAVIVPSHNSEQVWLISIPVMSFDNWKAYVLKLSRVSNNGKPTQVCDVITELFMEGKKLTFKESSWTPVELKQPILNIWKEGTAKEVVGANDTPIKGLLEAPKKVEQIEAPKIIGSARTAPIESKSLDFQKLNSDIVEKRSPGRPRKEPLAVEGIAREEDIPAFLKPKPSTRGGVVSNPEAPPPGLASALEDAFKLSLE